MVTTLEGISQKRRWLQHKPVVFSYGMTIRDIKASSRQFHEGLHGYHCCLEDESQKNTFAEALSASSLILYKCEIVIAFSYQMSTKRRGLRELSRLLCEVNVASYSHQVLVWAHAALPYRPRLLNVVSVAKLMRGIFCAHC